MPNGQPLGVEQWGKSTSTGEYVTHTFPIKFTVIPIVVAGALTSNTSGNTGSQSNPCYRSITVSNFVFCMYDNARGYAGSTYIAIGYQLQWGINIGGAVQTSTLPITFTNVFLAVASTSTEWCCPGCSATNTTVTTRAYQSNRPDVAQPNDVNWIVIGCQPQWGYVKSTKVTFPIQFNIIYTVLGNAHGSNNSNNDHYFLASFSTTEASFNYSNMNFTGLSWIAIGSA